MCVLAPGTFNPTGEQGQVLSVYFLRFPPTPNLPRSLQENVEIMFIDLNSGTTLIIKYKIINKFMLS